MRLENNTLLQNNKRLVRLKFGLSLSGSLLLSSTNLLGMDFSALAETPLGSYEERALPAVRRLPSRHVLPMTPAKDQDPLGTCTSFAVSACGEHFSRTKRFSEAEFTVLAETQLPTADCKPGLHLGKALEVARTLGFVEEDKLPYDNYLRYVAWKNQVLLGQLKDKTSLDICRRDSSRATRRYNPKDSYNNTMREMKVDLQLSGTMQDVGYRLPPISPLHHVSRGSLALATRSGRIEEEAGSIGLPTRANIESVKQALYRGCPVAAALPVFSGCWEPDAVARNNYCVLFPGSKSKHVGFHAVVLTGFDEDRSLFAIKNSWGRTWGKDGFAFIPYNYVEVYATELVAVGE